VKENVINKKSYDFSLRIVNMFQHLTEHKREFVLSKQCLKIGTSIGALVNESVFAQSRADFINKLSIAAKEANETKYWLLLLKDTGYIDEKSFKSISNDCDELIKLLTTIIKTSKATSKK
jgi:four helix bundle protein